MFVSHSRWDGALLCGQSARQGSSVLFSTCIPQLGNFVLHGAMVGAIKTPVFQASATFSWNVAFIIEARQDAVMCLCWEDIKLFIRMLENNGLVSGGVSITLN